MGRTWLLGAVGTVLVTLVACSAGPADEAVGGGASRVTAREFDKNMVLSDSALRDSAAMTTEDIQAFLDETPWKKTSVLANYEEDGKSAAEIMHDAADKHGINPLELLVRVQMEQGLINKATASDETISIAFGCGCPHSPVCSSKYEGFANQADCAAGTLRRSMDRAGTSQGTVSGWKKGSEKLSQDKVEIVPQNAATAALYTYTPWVGEAGGGKKGVGGASLHHAVWSRFADAVSYGAAAPSDSTNTTPRVEEVDAATADPTPPQQGSSGTNGNPPPPSDPDPEPTPDPDPEPGQDADAGSPADSDAGDAGKKKGDTSEGSDDDDILGEGNAPPSSNVPPPSSSSGPRGKSGGEEKATDEELAPKKKTDEGGCSSTGSHGGSDAALAAMVLVGASLIASRRRRQASLEET